MLQCTHKFFWTKEDNGGSDPAAGPDGAYVVEIGGPGGNLWLEYKYRVGGRKQIQGRREEYKWKEESAHSPKPSSRIQIVSKRKAKRATRFIRV